MSALGQLFIYVIYFILGIATISFLVLTFKRKNKLISGLATIIFGFLLYNFYSLQSKNYKENQLSQVGLYYLTEYPNCDSCIIELKENQTYKVKNNEQVIEKGNWHYEIGGDYWITYLNNDNYQLGNGKFRYSKYEPKYNKSKSE
jgi:hypothetical protein